jgi:hypothetical protein
LLTQSFLMFAPLEVILGQLTHYSDSDRTSGSVVLTAAKSSQSVLSLE